MGYTRYLISILNILAFQFESVGVLAQQYDGQLMADHSNYYRPLNCQECFQAQGRICHHKTYIHDFSLLQTSNTGIGVCCKLDTTQGLCSNDPASSDYVCSMKSIDAAATTYKDVITAADSRNYQMFAFCPWVRQSICGISDSDSNDVNIAATLTTQKVSTDKLYFKTTRTSAEDVRRYDFCHYMIKQSTDDSMHNFKMSLPDATLNKEIE